MAKADVDVDEAIAAVSDMSIEEQFRETQRAMVVGFAEMAKASGLNTSLVTGGATESQEVYWRFLTETDWNLDASMQLLKSACEWHERNGAALGGVLEETYTKQPGLFSLRQVGHDKEGHPVLYICFGQSSATPAEHTVDAVISFAQNIVGNACRTNRQGKAGEQGRKSMLIIDCTGLQPKAVLKPTMLVKAHQTLTLLYPCTIDSILLYNYNQDTRNTWKELKGYISEDLASKVKFVPLQNTSRMLITKFPADVGEWLKEELAANKSMPLSDEQVRFWASHSPHDPRASPSYIAEFIDKQHADHKPHPGILYGK